LTHLPPTSADSQLASYPGIGTKSYRGYVLGMLTLLYTLNYLDRMLLSVLQEPIKLEFKLTDFQLGLLGGPAFAVLYTLAGIPIARLAERANRVNILSFCVALWSGMTAVCGMATGYAMLFMARVGVGIGEAGCTPGAQSILSDYFPANRRATALAVYALGLPLGTIVASVFGAAVAQAFGWRAAFLALGIPGIIVAVIVRLTLREPERASSAEAPNFMAAVREILGKPTFRNLALAYCIANFVGYGVGQYLTSFLVRVHELPLARAGQLTGLAFYACGAAATILSGLLTDRLQPRRPTAPFWLCAIGCFAAVPCFLFAYQAPTIGWAIPGFMLGTFSYYLYNAPAFSITHGIVQPRMRATAVALLILAGNLIGYGLGPPTVGMLSDMFANYSLAGTSQTLATCREGGTLLEACHQASAQGLRVALSITVLGYGWAALHFLRARRTIRNDWVG
jgi:predicted MFS family arabinose efflux permease